MNKFFKVVGIYATCVFIHICIETIAERAQTITNKEDKEEEPVATTNACGFEVESESYDYSDEEEHERLDRIGF